MWRFQQEQEGGEIKAIVAESDTKTVTTMLISNQKSIRIINKETKWE